MCGSPSRSQAGQVDEKGSVKLAEAPWRERRTQRFSVTAGLGGRRTCPLAVYPEINL